MAHSNSAETSRAKYHRPELLGAIIDILNLLPPEIEMPEQRKVFLTAFGDDNKPKSQKQAFDALFGIFPKSAQNELLTMLTQQIKKKRWYNSAKAAKEDALFDANTIWYDKIRQWRIDLYFLALYFSKLREKEGMKDTLFFGGFHSLAAKLEFEGTVMRVTPTQFAAALDGVDGDRIRICVICKRIFWAGRKDSQTDSNKCLNALRQRRHRKKNREEVNLKRRENYQYKNGKKRRKK